VRLFRVVGFLVLLLALALPVWGKTVYVGTSGNDGNGCDSTTSTTRRRTINGGIDCLNGGDTLIVGSGVYAERMDVSNIPNGSGGSPTLIKSEVMRGAILRPNGAGTMIQFTGNKSNIVVDGFVLDGINAGYGVGGLDFQASGGLNNLLVMNLEIKNFTADDQNDGSGFYHTTNGAAGSYDASNVVMRNLLIHDIGMNCAGGGCCNECFGYGIYLSGTGYTLEQSEFYNTTGWTVHGYCSGSSYCASNNIVRNNYFHDSGGPFLLCQRDNQVYNNILARFGQFGRALGTGIQFAGACGGETSTNNRVYNNTIVNVTGNCIDGGYGFNNIMQNNICYQTGDDSPNGGTGGGSTVTNNLTGANPLFVNGALSQAAHFQLQSGSPARNAGVSTASLFTTDYGGNARIQEGTQDIGAWEFGGGAPPSQAPIGWWKLNEGAGTTAADSSGNGYTITLAGTPVPTWVPGKVGSNALRCAGTGGTARTTAAFNPAQYSWAMWIQGDAAPNTTSEQGPFIGGNWGFLWSLTDIGGDQAAFHQLSDTTYVDVRIPTQLAGQVWYHVGATWDGSTLRVYLNGQLAASGIAGSLNPTTDPLRLCGDPGDNSFAGRLDDVYIWDRAITAAEMAAQFAAVKSKRPRHHVSMR
jgi:hypothetical protein